MKIRPLKERFLNFIKMSSVEDCWEWKGATRNGYGAIGLGGRKEGIEYAHRLSFRFFVGEIPFNKHILHKCDNRRCVNPSHLYAGTRSDNIKDAYNRKRREPKPMYGEKHPLSKLNNNLVLSMRDDHKHGLKISAIAKQYEVSYKCAHNICTYQGWRHLP